MTFFFHALCVSLSYESTHANNRAPRQCEGETAKHTAHTLHPWNGAKGAPVLSLHYSGVKYHRKWTARFSIPSTGIMRSAWKLRNCQTLIMVLSHETGGRKNRKPPSFDYNLKSVEWVQYELTTRSRWSAHSGDPGVVLSLAERLAFT